MDGNVAIKSRTGAAHVIVTPTGPLLGAEIAGIDLTKPLSEAEVAAVNAALSDYAQRGALSAHVHARYPFERLLEAFDEIAGRSVIGRVVVECPEP